MRGILRRRGGMSSVLCLGPLSALFKASPPPLWLYVLVWNVPGQGSGSPSFLAPIPLWGV